MNIICDASSTSIRFSRVQEKRKWGVAQQESHDGVISLSFFFVIFRGFLDDYRDRGEKALITNNNKSRSRDGDRELERAPSWMLEKFGDVLCPARWMGRKMERIEGEYISVNGWV